MKRKIIVSGWGLIFLFQVAAPFNVQAASPAANIIRIVLLKDMPEATVKINYPYKIIDPQSGQVLEEGRRLLTTQILAAERGIQVGERFFDVSRLRFVPQREMQLRIRDKDRRYRGEIEIVLQPQKKFFIINRLNVEEYIKGVLYHEASHRWPMETIKAQAVASRTYAHYQIQMNAAKDFDGTNDIYSQVYGGRTSEKYRTNMAVDRTRGQVLTYEGKIFPAYFHATCGGFTEDVRELWNHDLPPLRGWKCNFCLHSPHYHWKRNLRLKDIQDKLNEHDYQLGLIKEIKIMERNKSGRIRKMEIITRDGKTVEISGKDFRNIIGPNVIRSNNYEIVMQGYYADFIGKGWGHGVGLCQWGAFEMANRHYDYNEILQFYYPGTKLEQVPLKNSTPATTPAPLDGKK